MDKRSKLMLRTAQANLPAEDMARAKAFYTGKLGMSLVFESEMGAALEASDGTGIFLYPHERTVAAHTAASFMTDDDLTTIVKELRGRGVSFEDYDQPGLKTVDGVAQLTGVKSAWFVDSEGNIIAINQIAV